MHSIILKDGRHIQGKEALNLWTAVEDLLAKGIEHSRSHTAEIPANLSLLDWFQGKVEELEIPSHEKDRMLQVVHDWGGYSGETIETQSFKNFWLENNMPGGMYAFAPQFTNLMSNSLQIISWWQLLIQRYWKRLRPRLSNMLLFTFPKKSCALQTLQNPPKGVRKSSSKLQAVTAKHVTM